MRSGSSTQRSSPRPRCSAPAAELVFRWASQTEAGRATLAWKLLRHIADNPADTARDAVLGYATRITRTSAVDDTARAFVQMVFSPLFDFLIERVSSQSSVLYVLERYLRRVEWFERGDLYRRYLADRQNGKPSTTLTCGSSCSAKASTCPSRRP